MKFLNLLFFIFILTGCQKKIPTPIERKSSVLLFAQEKNFKEINIKTSTFTLFSLQNKSVQCKNKELKIYIEGDGLSWVSRNIVSSNPTPIEPISLKLMLKDDSSCKIYIARPCQYTTSNICEEKYWTNERFSKEILDPISVNLK